MSNRSESTDEAPRPASSTAPEPAPAEPAMPAAGPAEVSATESGDEQSTPSEEASAADTPSSTTSESSTPPEMMATSEPAEETTAAAETSSGQEHPGAGEASAAGQSAEGAPSPDGEDGAKKKRRRRRRKKKKASESSDGESQDAAPKKAASPAPLAAFLEGPGGTKRHAFSVGEVVAGRVSTVHEGTIEVDLFGKATAVIDAYEPREIEPLPEVTVAPVAPTAGVPAESADGSTAESADGSTADATGETAVESVAELSEAPKPDAPEVTGEGALASTEAGELEAPLDSDGEAQAPEESDEESATAAEVPPEEEGPPPEPPAIGSIFRGRVGAVSESGHVGLVNRAVDRAQAKAMIAAARDARRRVRGVVFGFNRGGFDVLVHGIRTFCPASGMVLGAVDDPRSHVGQKYEFSVQARKASGQGFVISRRGILERDARKQRRARLRELEVGTVISGQVTQVRDFGIFVDVGEGLEGLVHQSELSWTRGVRPADVAVPGDEVEVKVLKVGAAERKKEDGPKKRDRQPRVSLSIKAQMPDPWDAHGELLEEGKWHEGTVVSTTEFGAFVQLAPGVEGLVHISELGKDLKHAKQALEDGASVHVVVERVDRGQRRLSLSRLTDSEVKAIKEGTLDPANRPRSLKPGSHVKVVVDRVEHGGATVHIQGLLGKKGRGFLPNRELGSYGSGDKRRSLSSGQELEVKITGVDRDGGFRLSIKGREVDDERKAVREYRKEAAKQGLGTFGDLLRAKLPTAGSE